VTPLVLVQASLWNHAVGWHVPFAFPADRRKKKVNDKETQCKVCSGPAIGNSCVCARATHIVLTNPLTYSPPRSPTHPLTYTHPPTHTCWSPFGSLSSLDTRAHTQVVVVVGVDGGWEDDCSKASQMRNVSFPRWVSSRDNHTRIATQLVLPLRVQSLQTVMRVNSVVEYVLARDGLDIPPRFVTRGFLRCNGWRACVCVCVCVCECVVRPSAGLNTRDTCTFCSASQRAQDVVARNLHISSTWHGSTHWPTSTHPPHTRTHPHAPPPPVVSTSQQDRRGECHTSSVNSSPA
jgi:hypothetical protein